MNHNSGSLVGTMKVGGSILLLWFISGDNEGGGEGGEVVIQPGME